MVIATYLLDAKGNERLVVELSNAGAVLEHRFVTPKGVGKKVTEYGPQCEVLLHFADMVQENVFSKMPCDECLACAPSRETDEIPVQESEGDSAPAENAGNTMESHAGFLSRRARAAEQG